MIFSSYSPTKHHESFQDHNGKEEGNLEKKVESYTEKHSEKRAYHQTVHSYFNPQTPQSYVHIPSGTEIVRVHAHVLGDNEIAGRVYGRTWMMARHIEIRSDLYDEDFDEVLDHETKHLLHPDDGEFDIRRRVKEGRSHTHYH